MADYVRKIVGTLLIVFVLFFTVLAILSIWDILEVQYILSKTFKTLGVIFASSLIMLFVFSVIYKNDQPPKQL